MSTELQQFDSLRADLTTFVAPTKDLQVSDAQSNTVASDTLRKIKDFQKKIEGKRVEMVAPLNGRVKEINDYAKDISAPLAAAEAHVKQQMAAFATAELERRRAEQQRMEEERRRQEAEAREKADKERKERDEALRIERETAAAKAKEEQAAMVAFGARADKEAAAKEQAEIAARAQRAEAERIVQQSRESQEREKAYKADLKKLEDSRPKDTRTEWRFEILNPATIPREFLMIDDSAVRRAILKGAREIPGVRIYSELVVRARGA